MDNLIGKLDALYKRVMGERKCVFVGVQPNSAAGWTEAFSPWLSGAFPRSITVDKCTVLVADDMELIAALVNAYPQLREMARDAERYRKLKAAMTVPGAMQSFIAHMNWHPDTFNMGIDEAIDAAMQGGDKSALPGKETSRG